MEEAKHDDEMDEAEGEEDMKEAEDDTEESEDEAEEEETEEGEEEDVEIEDMEVEDLKNLIRDLIAQELGHEHDGDEIESDEEGGVEDMVGAEDEGDEEIELDELLAELEDLVKEVDEEVDEDLNEETITEEEQVDEVSEEVEASQELAQALETIKTLRQELSEVNLLNSKLLYLNKIFKAYSLTESQKVDAVTTFDKAENVKEVKLVYETFVSSIENKQQIKEHKAFASKATGTTTKPEVISEVSDQVKRMQKLAGIL